MKRILSLLMIICLVSGMAVQAMAAEDEPTASDDLRSRCEDCLALSADPTEEFKSNSPYVPGYSLYTAEEKAAAVAAYESALGSVSLQSADLQTAVKRTLCNCDPMKVYSESPARLMSVSGEVRPSAEHESYLEALRDQAPVAYLLYIDIFDEMSAILRGEKTPDVKIDESGSYLELSLPSFNNTTYSTDSRFELIAENYVIAVSAFIGDRPLEEASFTNKVGVFSDSYNVTLQMYFYGDPVARYEALCAACGDFYAGFCANRLNEAGTSPEMQYRYIHDYLCARLHYNREASQFLLTGDESRDTHSAFGALCGLGTVNMDKGHVVCEGYARAFQLLCQVTGLPCTTIIGSESIHAAAADHIWNAVRIGDGWYCIDLTWDDINDITYANDSCLISADLWKYRYFLDNSSFLPGAQQSHKALSQLEYDGGSFELGAPEIMTDPIACPDRPSAVQWVVLTLAPADSEEIMKLEDGTGFLGYSVTVGDDTIDMSAVPGVCLCLTESAEAVTEMEILSGKRWIIRGEGENVTVTRGMGFSGSIFDVYAGGTLTLDNLTLDGSGQETGNALIRTETAVFTDGVLTSRAMLLLQNADICGNRGAAGIEMDGFCEVRGAVRVRDNYSDIAGTQGKNLVIGKNGWLKVSGSLCPEVPGYLGITAAAGTNCGSLWAEDISGCLTVLHGDGECTCTYETGTAFFGISGQWTLSATVSAAELRRGEGSFILFNGTGEDCTVSVFLAAYDENGRQTGLSAIKREQNVCFAVAAGESLLFDAQAFPGSASLAVFVLDGNVFTPFASKHWG